MSEICKLCGEPFSEQEPELARGMHGACYQRVYRRQKQEKEIQADAQAIANEVGEKYGVELTLDELPSPMSQTPVEFVLSAVDVCIVKRLGGVPKDDPVAVLGALTKGNEQEDEREVQAT